MVKILADTLTKSVPLCVIEADKGVPMENQKIIEECVAELEELYKNYPELKGVQAALDLATQGINDPIEKMEVIFRFISDNIRKETEPNLRKLVNAYDCFHTNLDPDHQFEEKQ